MSAPRQVTLASSFADDLKHLAKKEPDLGQVVTDQLAAIAGCQGRLPGDLIPGIGGAPVYKVRLACGHRGKRGGYRLIYYCAEQLVRALFIYRKSDEANIHSKVIANALKAAGLFDLPLQPR